MVTTQSVGSAPKDQSNKFDNRTDVSYGKVVSCVVDRRPKTGTKYRGVLDTGNGLPTVFVSEVFLAPGARHYFTETRWRSIEQYGPVLELKQTRPVGATD